MRDGLVVSLKDSSLSERMQLDKALTLAKAITMTRQSEEIKRQQNDLRCEASTNKTAINMVHVRNAKLNKFKSKEQKRYKSPKLQQTKQEGKTCSRCRKAPAQAAVQCPDRNVKCHNCGKRGHYGRVCRSNPTVNEVADNADGFFLCEVNSGEELRLADINVRGSKVTFKLDSGADVTAIPVERFADFKSKNEHLEKAQKPLDGPGGTALQVLVYHRDY